MNLMHFISVSRRQTWAVTRLRRENKVYVVMKPLIATVVPITLELLNATILILDNT